MSVTIAQIAKRANVSRGTVDRVLHDRGKVDPETASRIRLAMEELDYHPNILGKAFAMARQKRKIGLLVSLQEEGFRQQVMEGVRDGIAYAEQYGFEVLARSAAGDDHDGCLGAIEDFAAVPVSGVALNGVVFADVKSRLAQMRAAGVRIVAFNSDMDEPCRDSFVGQDHRKSGACAGSLMEQICPGEGEILIVGMEPEHWASAQRIESFCAVLSAAGRLRPREPLYCNGRNDLAYQRVLQALTERPVPAGVFISGAALGGTCQALCQARLAGKLKVIGFDTIEPNVQYLRQGTVQFLIDQNPYQQGYLPLRVLTESLFYGRAIEKSYYDTGIAIKNTYTL